MKSLCIFAASVAALTACARQAPQQTPDAIVAAERAFAADGYERGVKASFLKFSASDAIILGPDPVNAHESLSQQPDLDPDAPRQHLVWWPLWAGIARSGDLGFTTGPFAVDDKRLGHYFTVWKKQPDGEWRWVFDAGVGADPSAEDPQGSPAGYLPIADSGSKSADAAFAAVAEAEAALAGAAQSNLVEAYSAHLAPDARVHSEGPPPAKSAAAHEGALAARATTMIFSNIGGGASAAGDLVWTYGDVHWAADDAGRRGHYARIWQKRGDGWQIVFDEVVPFSGPQEENQPE